MVAGGALRWPPGGVEFRAGIDRSWRCHEPTSTSGVPGSQDSKLIPGFSKSFGSHLRNSYPIIKFEVSYKASRSCASNATSFAAIRQKLRAPGVRIHFLPILEVSRTQWGCRIPGPQDSKIPSQISIPPKHGIQDPRVAVVRCPDGRYV